MTEAWSPLAQGAVLDDPVLTEIAEAHGKTTGQVVLRWHVQLGNVVFPKSVTPERIEENFDIFDFHLSEDEMGQDRGAGRRRAPGPGPGHVRPALARCAGSPAQPRPASSAAFSARSSWRSIRSSPELQKPASVRSTPTIRPRSSGGIEPPARSRSR